MTTQPHAKSARSLDEYPKPGRLRQYLKPHGESGGSRERAAAGRCVALLGVYVKNWLLASWTKNSARADGSVCNRRPRRSRKRLLASEPAKKARSSRVDHGRLADERSSSREKAHQGF